MKTSRTSVGSTSIASAIPPHTPASTRSSALCRRRGRAIAVIVRRAPPRPGRPRRRRRARASARRRGPAGRRCRRRRGRLSWLPSTSLSPQSTWLSTRTATPVRDGDEQVPDADAAPSRRSSPGGSARLPRSSSSSPTPSLYSSRSAGRGERRVGAVADAVVEPEVDRRGEDRRRAEQQPDRARGRATRRWRNAPTTTATPTAPAATASAIAHGTSTPAAASDAEDAAPITSRPSTAVASANDAPAAARRGGRLELRARLGRGAAVTSLQSRGPSSEQHDPGDEHEHPRRSCPFQKCASRAARSPRRSTSASPTSRHGRSRRSRSACSTIDSLAALVGDDERGGEVDQDPRAAEQREHDEPDAVEHGVDVEVAAEAAADAGDHPIRAAAAQLLVCERLCHGSSVPRPRPGVDPARPLIRPYNRPRWPPDRS